MRALATQVSAAPAFDSPSRHSGHEERLPFSVFGKIVREQRPHRCAGFSGLAIQDHSGFLQRLASLASIARRARADDVVPYMRPAAVPRDHVIDRQVVGLNTAVLTGEIIAAENRPAGKLETRTRPPHLVRQPDNRWPRELGGRCMDLTAAVQDDLGFAAHKQDHCPMRMADI